MSALPTINPEQQLDPSKVQICRVNPVAYDNGQPCACPVATCNLWRAGLKPAGADTLLREIVEEAREGFVNLDGDSRFQGLKPTFKGALDQARRYVSSGVTDEAQRLRAVLARIAAIEIERGMDGDEAIERGIAAVGYAQQAIARVAESE